MNVAPISFGQIIKVNAPLETADKIVNLVNGNRKSWSARAVKNIFYDYEKGEAVAYNPTGRKDVSYIFSGSDANKAREIENEMIIESERVCDYYSGDKELVNAGIASAYESACKKLNALIKSKKHVYSIDTILPNDGSKNKLGLFYY